MTIGGYDLLFTAYLGGQALQNLLINICKQHWPTCVVEFDPEPGHFYVYQDMKKAVAVEARLDDSSIEYMIYFITSESCEFTAVVDDPAKLPAKPIVDNLRSWFKEKKYEQPS